MNWFNLIDETIAQRQLAWERRQAVFRAVNAGATRREISKKLGICEERVSQIYLKAARSLDPAPVKMYCDHGGEIEALAYKIRYHKTWRPVWKGSKYYVGDGYPKYKVIAGPFDKKYQALSWIEKNSKNG